MFKNTSIKLKFIVLSSIIIMALVSVTCVTLYLEGNTIKILTKEVKNKGFDVIDLVLNADRDMYQSMQALQQISFNNLKGEEFDEWNNQFSENGEQTYDRVKESYDILKKNDSESFLTLIKEDKTLNEYYTEFLDGYSKWTVKTKDYIESQNYEYSKYGALSAEFEGLRTYLDVIGETVKERTDTEVANSKKSMNISLIVIIAICLLCVIITSLIVFYIYRSITQIIKTLHKTSEKILNNENNVQLDINSNNETSKIYNSFNKIANKVYWYEQLLDNVNLPLSVVDKNSNLVFLNSFAEKVLNLSKESLYGKKYKTWKSSEYYDASENLLNINDKYYIIKTSTIYSNDGSKNGSMEILIDVSKEIHVKIYQKNELNKLFNSLDKLSEGDLDFEYTPSENNEYTRDEFENFNKIGDKLNITIKSINTIIVEITGILDEISNSNLDVEVKETYSGDFIKLKNSLSNIIINFNKTLTEINKATEQVSINAGQFKNSSQQLSNGATEQASSLQQLNSSITVVNEQTKSSAESSKKASEISEIAKKNALNGNERMSEMVEAMNIINESSKNISKIIKVIDEIAFQTNILSLNAAVEAARAGQHGKGFAVVAEEVRNLAARSAEAANETTELIENTISKVGIGSKIANDTASGLSAIVDSIEKSAELVKTISNSSEEQAQAVEQIKSGINQISDVTQSNSATAQENAAASQELSNQVLKLKSKVDNFTLKNQNSKLNKYKADNVLKNSDEAHKVEAYTLF